MACCRSLPICADTAGILMRWVLVSSLACHPKLAHVSHERKVAERGGFEPPCPLRDKTLSRRPRYDHFGTSPGRWATLNLTVIACEAETTPRRGQGETLHHEKRSTTEERRKGGNTSPCPTCPPWW